MALSIPWIRPYKLWLVAPVLFLAIALVSCASEEAPSTLEEGATAIDRTLICPVCPGETIDQSQVELAGQMRAIVREMLAQGKSPGQIREFFVTRYGEGVLAAPAKQGFSLVAWLAPIAGVMIALAALALVLRRMALTRKPAQQEEELDEGSLQPYLEMVDAHLEKEGLLKKEKSPPPPKSEPWRT